MIRSTQSLRRVTNTVKRIVAYRYEYKCADCRVLLPPTWECDHIVPLWKIARDPSLVGGKDPNHISNLQPLCRNCHGQKTLRETLELHELDQFENGKSEPLESFEDLLEIQNVSHQKPDFYYCPTCKIKYSPYFEHSCWTPDFHKKFSFCGKDNDL